jgi:hypothetical protein
VVVGLGREAPAACRHHLDRQIHRAGRDTLLQARGDLDAGLVGQQQHGTLVGGRIDGLSTGTAARKARTRSAVMGASGATVTFTWPSRPSMTLISTTPSFTCCTGTMAWARK